MSVTVVSPNSRRTFVLSLVLYIVLVPLLQAGLGYISLRTSSPWFWLAGTPVAYLLIGGFVAFCGTGGLPAAQARGKAAQIAVSGSLLGALMAALIVATYFVPMFVVANLLGVALAPLGGLLGGSLRTNVQPVDAPAQGVANVSEPTKAGIVVIAVVVLAMVLALLVGVVGLLLITGTFPASR